jgi:hypothetical protein
VAVDVIDQYAVDFADSVKGALAPAAPTAQLNELIAAAAQLSAATTQAAWNAASNQWIAARQQLEQQLRNYLLDGMPAIPGLDAVVNGVGWESAEGLQGKLALGPLTLSLSSSSLTVQPKLPDGTIVGAFVIGPFQPSAIAASIAAPSGDGLPGGGSIIRLPNRAGFGGTLSIPLGPVSVDASTILERMPDGTPSFLAVMGVGFTPPIQLSFGFSLDRVGGLVGVNRTADTDALALAVRTGSAGDTLFAAGPPASPAALIDNLRRFLPSFNGRHLIAPTLRLAWLSMGSGKFVYLDLGVVIELPTGRIIVLGVARASLPSLPGLINLRLDVLGVVDPGQSLVAMDASLVDSHVLGVFSVYGDAGLRMNWGSQAYSVISIGGFYPGFNPEPARLPALRRAGLTLEALTPGIEIRAEGYLAVTTNTIQLGGRLDVTISMGLSAHGFLQIDALVQYRPFQFVATASAGFDVRAGGFSFCGVRLDGTVSGPGPLVVHGTLTIDTFLFDISWDETFTIGSGPGDLAPNPGALLQIMADEVGNAGNFRAASSDDPAVVLAPRGGQPGIAAVPPTGMLKWSQRRAPLGFPIDRVDGLPLGSAQGVRVTTPGAEVPESFAPGSYCNLTQAEKLNRPPFDILNAGVVLANGAPAESAPLVDNRDVDVIIILGPNPTWLKGIAFDLGGLSALVAASQSPAALSDASRLIKASRETWATVGSAGIVDGLASATAAHQFARHSGGHTVALASADAKAPLDLSGL